ncbi:hypothetical protein BH09BAC5_BH09BAC5_06610 [soil metagenome]
MNGKRKSIVLIYLFAFLLNADAQLFQQKNIGANIGLVLAIGNRVDRIGINVSCFYFDNFFQVNADSRIYFNLKNLGPDKKYMEAVASLGIVFGYGKTSNDSNLFFSTVSNQTKYLNSFAYSYNCYFNKIKTTQQTGIFAVQVKEISILVENDIFARPRLDRFRTGAVLVQYQYKDFQFGINATLWTGQMGNRIITSNPAFPNGYMDTTNAIYPEFSHGLLSGQIKYLLPYSQTAQANIGYDAEQIRNFMQNQFLHHLFSSKNASIPMLDNTGNPYLFQEGQKLKPAHFYYNTFLNPSLFY